jgi:hypothetical protein
LRRNAFYLFVTIVFLIIGIILGGLAEYVAEVSVNSKDMLQSLIQAEATVLGFFGIVVSYFLVSYDTRLDRLEQQRFDCELANKPQAVDSYCKKMISLKEIKQSATRTLGGIGILFILSLLLSILALGAIDTNSTFSTGFAYFGLGAFFTGIVGLVLSFFVSTE